MQKFSLRKGKVEMSKQLRRALSAVLALLMVLTLVPCAFAYNASPTSNKDQWIAMAKHIPEEGIVLMKNNGTLPLKTRKVNLLGYAAYNPVYSGAGSGNTASNTVTSFKDSLKAAGIEYNPAVEQAGVYKNDSKDEEGLLAKERNFFPSLEQHEVSVDKFTGSASFDAMKNYSNTAVMVIGRNGGEGSDLNDYDSVDGRGYLEISKNEEDILSKASKTFDHVIVILNMANMMNMDFLKKYNVDAVLWVGIPGSYGLTPVGKILTGAVNPSGRLPDTWLYNNDSNPAVANGWGTKASNANAYKIDYAEGIYVGYKFFETAFAEKAKINGYDYGNYNSVVAFPFGTGKSYTSFSQKMSGVPKKLDPRGKFDVKVKVKNTGDTAGRDAVQVYVTVPYTTYDKNHGVEKSAVTLVGVGKTDVLQPGKSQTVKVPVDMQQIASYDETYKNANGTKGAYMLDGGVYTFSIRSNSHDVIESRAAKLEDNYFFSGANKRDSDDQQAYNQFTDVERGQYLSRKNGFANYNASVKGTPSTVKDMTFQNNPNKYLQSMDKQVTKHYVKGVDYDAPGSLVWTQLAGKSYDDPMWQKLISQISLDDLVGLTRLGNYHTIEIDSIGHPQTYSINGPLGITNQYNDKKRGVGYPTSMILAATFNPELAYKYGTYLGDEAHTFEQTGIYGPGADIHRSGYSGRNYEYFSEDAALSGIMNGHEIKGLRDKGMVTYTKHFALNDTETQRGGNLHTYASEQAIREIYLRPFEDGVKYGGGNGMMGGLNFVGDVWTNCSEPLMTEVLRNEWGFRGVVCSDQDQNQMTNKTYFAGDTFLRAGSDIWIGFTPFLKTISSKSDADIYYLQRMAHQVLYAEVNSYIVPATVNALGIPTSIMKANDKLNVMGL